MNNYGYQVALADVQELIDYSLITVGNNAETVLGELQDFLNDALGPGVPSNRLAPHLMKYVYDPSEAKVINDNGS